MYINGITKIDSTKPYLVLASYDGHIEVPYQCASVEAALTFLGSGSALGAAAIVKLVDVNVELTPC